jgi:microcystin-dependent protein
LRKALFRSEQQYRKALVTLFSRAQDFMKKRVDSSVSSLLKAGGLAAALAWSSASHACVPEPYISAVCIMAIPWTNLHGYAPANGATLNLSTNQTLFSLIGVTYGGNATTNFMLPDLQGRVVVGAGAGVGLPVYRPGDKGGAASVVLTSANVPLIPHTHDLSGVVVTTGPGTMVASTTLSGLSATVSMSGVTGSVNGSSLTLNGYSGSGSTISANGAALATPATPASKIYASNAPDVAMKAGSISGTAPVTFSGNPAVTIAGGASTTLSGAPSVVLGGTTGSAGANPSAPLNIMPPYLAMNYFIAVQGLYPSRD